MPAHLQTAPPRHSPETAQETRSPSGVGWAVHCVAPVEAAMVAAMVSAPVADAAPPAVDPVPPGDSHADSPSAADPADAPDR